MKFPRDRDSASTGDFAGLKLQCPQSIHPADATSSALCNQRKSQQARIGRRCGTVAEEARHHDHGRGLGLDGAAGYKQSRFPASGFFGCLRRCKHLASGTGWVCSNCRTCFVLGFVVGWPARNSPVRYPVYRNTRTTLGNHGGRVAAWSLYCRCIGRCQLTHGVLGLLRAA